MLRELRVRALGVIDDATLLLGPGLTALTGETGAGKTLLVEAIELLLGGRADPVLVRPGAGEAVIEGRFELAEDGERILSRVVSGRSRAYVDGRMASASALADVGAALVDLHGQHAYQALVSPASQRDALDRSGRIDLGPLAEVRAAQREVAERQAALGGDNRARAREIDLLAFQLDELDRAGLDDPGEDDDLRAEEERLGDAAAHRGALEEAHAALSAEGAAADHLGAALAALAGRAGLAEVHDRLRSLAAELADGAEDLRHLAEAAEEDPERLAAIGARRAVLAELRRKYGDSVADVIAYRGEVARRLDDLRTHDATAAALDAAAAELATRRGEVEAAIGVARRDAAGPFAAAVEEQLHTLALPRARFEVDVDGGPAGEQVTWRLGANPGEPALPLSRVASGGELARTMLAARLVLGGAGAGSGAPTLVFDEVDAGIGGEAAVAVGRALADLATLHQVLVVTHLPQVAASADHQIVVTKGSDGDRTVASIRPVEGSERVAELSRMLSGRPDSETARRHAEELLASGARSAGDGGAAR